MFYHAHIKTIYVTMSAHKHSFAFLYFQQPGSMAVFDGDFKLTTAVDDCLGQVIADVIIGAL